MFDPIGTTPYLVTIASGTSVSVNLITLDDPNITLVDAGSLSIATSLTETAGVLEINGGTLSLGGGLPLSIDFEGPGGTLTVVPGGTVTSNGDGINAYNQATTLPASDLSTIVVIANGTILSGPHLNSSGSQPAGILAGYKGGTTSTVNASVFGNVTINNFANINAGGGDGIRGYNYGIGNITITDETNTTITAPGEYGIRTANYGSGNVSVTTSSGDTINSGASGISAINFATAISSSAGTTINVVARGTINSGSDLNPSGSQPDGIAAGYFGSNGTINNAINGSVSVDNFANVAAAAGYGIDAFNYGNGVVTLTDESGTTVSGAQYGVGAYSIGTSGGPTTAITNAPTSTSSEIAKLRFDPIIDRNRDDGL